MVFVKKLHRSCKYYKKSDLMAAMAAIEDPVSATMDNYLKSWGLEMYADKFKEHSIGVETLQILSAEDLKELIPVIGHRAKLMSQIALLKNIINNAFSPANYAEYAANNNSTGIDETMSSSTCLVFDNSTPMVLDLVQNPPIEPEPTETENCKLYATLSSCNEGKGLLLRYQEKGLLDNASRRRLCNLIINNELRDDPEKRITSSRLYQLAYEITQVFKKESSSVYFIPFASFSPQQKISAKGKLLDCYRQRRRDCIKSGIIKSKEKYYGSASSSHSESGSPRPSSSAQAVVMQLQDYDENDIDEKILWLKNCCDPWETVEFYWKVTTKPRLSLLQSNDLTIQQYYSEFKALNQPGGIFLLLKDFECLYPDKNHNLQENWLLIRPKIIELAKKRTDGFLKEILLDIDVQNEETIDLAAFMSIPFLMSTSNVGKAKSKSKRLWRPSKHEVLEGFIAHVKSAAQIEETIARRVEKLREYDLTMQPYIIVVGPSVKNISARYIVVNNVRYEVSSCMLAVDACFKIIFVLNAQYPAECTTVWQFIQTALFKLKTKYDKIYTTVNTLLTDLNIQQE